MFPTKYLAIITAAALAFLSMGCIVDVEPDRAVNPVGTEHTVTMELRDPSELDEEVLCKIFLEVYEEVYGEEFPYEECYSTTNTEVLEYVSFYILDGPNAGANSAEDGVCEPACTEPTKEGIYSWTYESNGVPGRDVIEACSNQLLIIPPILEGAQSEEDEFERLLLDAINDVLGTDYESGYDLECQRVEKIWVPRQERAPNIGGGLAGLFQGQPTPLPTAAAPAPTAPGPVIRPPNTGDAGLK